MRCPSDEFYRDLKTNADMLRATRRQFLGQTARGIGAMALASLLHTGRVNAATPAVEPWRGIINPTHYVPRAKRVIFLYMAGGPSHLETFDYKPALEKLDGQPMPESYTAGQEIAQLQGQELK